MARVWWFPLLSLLVLSCSPSEPAPEARSSVGGKADTGWVADNSYELGGWLESKLVRKAGWPYAELATDRKQQETLIDHQVKYCKKTLSKRGFHFNQLAESIAKLEVSVEGETVTLTYRARVDMIGHRNPDADYPRLEDLDERELDVPLPLDPTGVYSRAGEDCAEGWHPYSLGEHKYYYYFAPDKEGCKDKVEQHAAKLTIDTVYPEKTAYPEYDRLLRALDDKGSVGFSAAIMPTDDNGQTQFEGHKRRIEELFQLAGKGEEQDEGKLLRYTVVQDGATAIIDLYNPEKIYFWSTWRKALGSYDVLYYDGHSNYGTYDMVNDPGEFADRYQVLMIDSCRSYAYYARQVFTSKGGFDKADVVGTGESNPFYVAPKVMGHLLKGLVQGVAALKRNAPRDAPSWQTIISWMNDDAYHVYYGAAGVRDNAWQPEPPTEPPTE